jgi:signal transduction histidine kinase
MGTAVRGMRAAFGTVRVRTTVLAVLVVGVALLVGAVALVVATRHILTNEVRDAARLRAADVAAALESGTAPGALGLSGMLGGPGDDDVLVQVLDAGGTVVASSPNVRGAPPIAQLVPGESARVRAPVDDGDYLAAAAAADTAQGRRTVLVARSLESVTESTQVLTGLLTVGLPVLLLVVAGTTWRVAGRALAPVDRIRREVDDISAADLRARVTPPAGTDEIARLATTMNRMLERLERAQAQQRRFVSDASHELRSPVASIRQHAEVALAHPDRTTVGALADTVLAEDLRVQRLVEDLLLLARADEGTIELRRRPLDLDDLVLAEARRLRGSSTLRVDTTGLSAGRVEADDASMRRVLRNLADNAARHAASAVAFSLSERNGSVLLRVDDDGPGIPATDRERVFERFVRLDDARARDAGGGGLGLAIVAELVAAHSGTATIEDSPLGGTRVEVRLPAPADPDG